MRLFSTTIRLSFLNLFLLLASGALLGQRSNGLLTELQASKKAKVLFQKDNQTPFMIECLEPVEMEPEQWLNTYLPEGVADRWVLVKSRKADQLGFVRHEFKQLYRGVEVEGGQYFVFEKQGKIVRAVGKFIPVQLEASAGNKALKTCRKRAIEAFLETIDGAKSDRQTVHAEHERTLKIVANEGHYHYAYCFRVSNSNPWNNHLVYIDAQSGELLKMLSDVHGSGPIGTAITTFYGDQNIETTQMGPNHYMLLDESRNIQVLDRGINQSIAYSINDADNIWDDTLLKMRTAQTTMWIMQKVHDIVSQDFDYTLGYGVSNPMNVYVASSGNESIYTDEGIYITYNGSAYTNAMVDLVAHEFMHWLIAQGSNLAATGEALAISESLSDIFGTYIEHRILGEEADYLIASERTATGIRSLLNPKSKGHADTYLGQWYSNNSSNPQTYKYHNAGVMNYWFYLLCEGGSGVNDFITSYHVNAIGMESAFKIVQRMETMYLTSTATFEDALYASQIAAQDLFGECSNELVQVTRAWEAVEVLASDAIVILPPLAEFEIEPLTDCTYPLNIEFINTSSFADSYLWDFGDGTTSTEESPSHIFATGSNYTVTLIAEGLNLGCSVPDTLVFDSLFSNTYSTVALPPACSVTIASNTSGPRLLEFQMGNVNNQTPSSPYVGYLDFSCSQFVEVYPGDQMKYKIRSSNANRHFMWVDFNNDGNFLPIDERVIQDFISQGETTWGYFTAPEMQSGELHARIRVSAVSFSGEVDPCAVGSSHETEDYRLVVKANPVAPEAVFEENKQYTYAHDSIAFRCLSTGGNLQRSWTFEGGIPAQSNAASPVVVYPNPGVYAVKLVVTNAMGVDSLVKTAYVRILESVNLCTTTATDLQEGFLFDMGGAGASSIGSYLRCGILIEPICSDSIVVKLNLLSGMSFNGVSLHAGESALAPIIPLTSAMLGQEIVIPGDKFFLKINTGSSNSMNLVMEWHGYQSIQFGENVDASEIILSDSTINSDETWFAANSDIDFVLQSRWDFGDGNEASGNEVMHQYAQAGSYQVNMETTYCNGLIENSSRQVHVLMDAVAEVSPDSIVYAVQCFEDVNFQISIQNLGTEALTWQVGGYDRTDSELNVLVLSNSVDTVGYLPSILSRILVAYPEANVVTTSSLVSAIIAELLNNTDVVILPLRAESSLPFSAELHSILDQFVEEGGRLIQLAPTQAELNSLGYTFSNYFSTSPSVISIVEPEPFYADGFGTAVTVDISLYPKGIIALNPNYVSVLTTNVNISVAGYRDVGFGRVFFIGHDLEDPFPLFDSVFTRMLGYGHLLELPAGISLSIWEGSTPIETTDAFLLQLDALIEGEYSLNFPIVFNDNYNEPVFVSVSLDIAGVGDLDFSESNLVFNNIPAFTSNSQFHYVLNTGCDTIYLDSVAINAPFFLAAFTDTMIVPSDSILLEVESQPLAAGTYSANLILYSDIEEMQIPITLTTVNSGGVVLSEPELNFSISNCESHYEGQFLVTNHSNSTIAADINSFSLESEQIKIGIFSNSVSSGALSNLQMALTQELDNIEIVQLFSTLNTTCDIVILGATALNSIDDQTLWSYVLLGGNLVILRQGSITSLNRFDLLEATAITMNSVGNTQGTVVEENGYTNGYETGQLVSFPAANSSFAFADTAYTSFINTVSGQSLFGMKEFGQGKVVYLGADYSQLSAPLRVLLKNTMNQARNLSNQQLVVSPNEFELAPGAQQLVDVSFVANNISEGINTIGLQLSTNEIGEANDTLLLNLNVNTPPCAEFTYSILCNNNVKFNSNAINGASTTYSWTFSNNANFSSADPSLIRFFLPGTYTATLRTCNSFGCDTTAQQFVINPPNSSVPAVCVPVNYVNSSSNYFKSIQIGNLNHGLILPGTGYTDFSCEYFANHTRGDIIPFEIKTSNSSSNRIGIWIDYNNDGLFNSTNELAYSSANPSVIHSGVFPLAGSGIVYGVPLRMRVLVKNNIILPNDFCQSSITGQYIDYVIYISDTLDIPVTEFIGAPLVINVGETVSFENQSSLSIYTTLQWIFPGGNPSTSTLLNPEVIYSNIGQYDVTLISTNPVGSDTLTKTLYVSVVDTLSLCGTDSITTYDVGSLYDSGGPSGNYQDNENCSYLIQPNCADTIVFAIDIIQLENNYDFLNIYDGTSASDPLIYSSTMGDQSSIYALSGSAFVRFTSDASYAPAGFEILWQTKFFNNITTPTPFISSSNDVIVFEEVLFQSSNVNDYNSVLWDFGDGITSNTLNPSHYYDQAGTYIVSQSIELCGNSYFFSDTIVVGGTLQYGVSDQSVEALVGCFSTLENEIQINNTGTIDLQWELNAKNYEDHPRVVYLYSNSDSTALNASIAMLSDSLNEAYIYSVNSSFNITAIQMLDTTDVLIIFKNVNIFSNLQEAMLSFIEQGGTVIYLQSSSNYVDDYVNIFYNSQIDLEFNPNLGNVFTEGFPDAISWFSTTNHIVADPLAVSLLQIEQQPISSFYYKDIFEGRVFYIGHSGVSSSIYNQALYRSVKYNNEKSDFIVPNWLDISALSGVIEPGGSAQIDFEFNTDTLPDGVYNFDFVVSGFDYGILDYPINLSLIKNVQPCPDFTYNVRCNGEVMIVNLSELTDTLNWIINGVSGYSGDTVFVQLNNSDQLSVQMLACNEITCVEYLEVLTIPIFNESVEFNCVPNNQSIWGNSTAILLQSASEELISSMPVNATDFYNDFSCSGVIYFKQNVQSSLELQFNQGSHYAVYFDKNGNASFDEGELLTSGFGSYVDYSFIVGEDVLIDSLLKLRLILDDNNVVSDPCSAPAGGTVFDFITYVVDETSIPLVSWNYSNLNCTFNYQFQNGTIQADSYVWNFGDGSTSNLPNPQHEYLNPGNYSVVLTATNSQGSASYSQQIQVLEPLAPILEISGLAVAENALQFSVSEAFDNYFWEFSTGQTSFDPSPVVVFPDSGFYQVSALVGTGSCFYSLDSTFRVDYIGNATSANFDFIQPDCGQSISFLNLSVNAINYTWNFGDGTSSTQLNPSHTFPNEGVYTVSLTANGLSNTDTEVVSIGVVNFDDVLNVSANSNPGTYTFNLENSYSSYFWTINGIAEGTTSSLTRNFNISGFYVIEVEVEKFGCSKTISTTLSIVTGIDNQSQPFVGVQLYPNPTLNQSVLEWSTNLPSDEMEVAVLDLTGRLIQQSTIEKTGVNTFRAVVHPGDAAGVYLVRLSAGNMQKFMKLMKE